MKLSGPLGIILTLALSLLIAAGIWFGYTSNQVDNYKAAIDDRDSSLAKVEYYDNKVKEIADTGVDTLGALYDKVLIVDALLPASAEGADAALIYPPIAQRAGLEKVTFAPATSSKDYKAFSLSGSGSYEEVTAFISEIESGDTLVTIGSMSLTPAGEDGYSLTIELRAHIGGSPVMAKPQAKE